MSRHTRGFPSMRPRGLGPVAFDESKTLVGNGLVSSNIRWTVAGAIDFGGGLDFRLTRLMSLRAEARDFVVSGNTWAATMDPTIRSLASASAFTSSSLHVPQKKRVPPSRTYV